MLVLSLLIVKKMSSLQNSFTAACFWLFCMQNIISTLIVCSGVSQLCVAINKLDTVSWSENRFLEIASKLNAFLKQAGYRDKDVTFVPCSGLTGENLTSPSTEHALNQWYTGPYLLQVIGTTSKIKRGTIRGSDVLLCTGLILILDRDSVSSSCG